jgi:hypothetical protein
MYNRLFGTSSPEELFAILHEYRQPVEYVYLSIKISPYFRTCTANHGGNPYLLKRSLAEWECTQLLFENSEVALYDVRACMATPLRTQD